MTSSDGDVSGLRLPRKNLHERQAVPLLVLWPFRGYGQAMRDYFRRRDEGVHWREAAAELFGGQGSYGNGSAMRVAPVGAYFADDLERCVEEARMSACVTHANAEGIEGAVAVAVAAACAARGDRGDEMYDLVLRFVLPGAVRDGIARAESIPVDAPVGEVAVRLGSGGAITCQDTVPYVLWCVARRPPDYRAAVEEAVAFAEDPDTVGAMVGAIVVLRAGKEALPDDWLLPREGL